MGNGILLCRWYTKKTITDFFSHRVGQLMGQRKFNNKEQKFYDSITAL